MFHGQNRSWKEIDFLVKMATLKKRQKSTKNVKKRQKWSKLTKWSNSSLSAGQNRENVQFWRVFLAPLWNSPIGRTWQDSFQPLSKPHGKVRFWQFLTFLTCPKVSFPEVSGFSVTFWWFFMFFRQIGLLGRPSYAKQAPQRGLLGRPGPVPRCMYHCAWTVSGLLGTYGVLTWFWPRGVFSRKSGGFHEKVVNLTDFDSFDGFWQFTWGFWGSFDNKTRF